MPGVQRFSVFLLGWPYHVSFHIIIDYTQEIYTAGGDFSRKNTGECGADDIPIDY